MSIKVNPKITRSTVFAKQQFQLKSRVEMNLRVLLNKCETMAKEEPIEGNWRLIQYVIYFPEMIATVSKSDHFQVKPLTIREYMNRMLFLHGIVKAAALSTPAEKLEAVQLLSHGAATLSAEVAQEIHQKTVVKFNADLRAELFGLENRDDTLRKRNIIKAPNFTTDRKDQESIDSLLKIHQNMQEKVAENMVMLTKSLKEQSQIASTIINRDTEALKKSSDLTDRNTMSLKAESDRLQVHSRSAWKWWLWIMLAVVMVIFINMVMFMKVMKKRKYEL